MKRRYWLDLRYWDEGFSGKHVYEVVGARIRTLDEDIMEQELGQLVLKTEDLERAKEQTVSRYHEFTGTTEAVQSVDIRARVAGFLEKIEFIGNTDVEEGDLLFEIERESYQAKRDRAFAT